MELRSKIIIALLACLQAPLPGSSTWSYSDVDKWGEIQNTMCGALRQSPINLDQSVAQFIGDIGAFVLMKKNADASDKYEMKNNGHSVEINIPKPNWNLALNKENVDQYTVAQIHYHWASEDSLGSEHTIDGNPYPLEMHIVSYDSKLYGSFDLAKVAPNGLAVIGVFFALADGATDLGKQSTFLTELPNVIKTSMPAVSIDPFELDILLPTNKDNFFRYSGSLTTPPCTENVQWTVLLEPLSVSKEQLALFRALELEDTNPKVNNFRPIQELNPKGITQPRVLYKSWNASTYTTVSWSLLLLSIFYSMK